MNDKADQAKDRKQIERNERDGEWDRGSGKQRVNETDDQLR